MSSKRPTRGVYIPPGRKFKEPENGRMLKQHQCEDNARILENGHAETSDQDHNKINSTDEINTTSTPIVKEIDTAGIINEESKQFTTSSPTRKPLEIYIPRMKRVELENQRKIEEEEKLQKEHQKRLEEAFFPERTESIRVEKSFESYPRNSSYNPFAGDFTTYDLKKSNQGTRSVDAGNYEGGNYESCGKSEPIASYGHLIEAFEFHPAFQTSDIDDIFYGYSIKIKRVDDTHAIIMFISDKDANDALGSRSIKKLIQIRPFSEASPKSKALFINHSDQFASKSEGRKATTNIVAARMISNSLQIRPSKRQEVDSFET
jgi:hypothetical protein